jgi:hypothetical protein
VCNWVTSATSSVDPAGRALPWFDNDAEANADMWATAHDTSEEIIELFRFSSAHAGATIEQPPPGERTPERPDKARGRPRPPLSRRGALRTVFTFRARSRHDILAIKAGYTR